MLSMLANRAPEFHELLPGKRSGENAVAVNLFYTLLSLNLHLWACGVVASYAPRNESCFLAEPGATVLRSSGKQNLKALQLRIMGKAVWFEPLDDEDTEDEEDQLLRICD